VVHGADTFQTFRQRTELRHRTKTHTVADFHPECPLGLVDEYRFVVSPVVAGEGRRLLEGVSLQEKLQLRLVESKIFKSGCVVLRYLKQ
jgi:RibD C-terminal domain